MIQQLSPFTVSWSRSAAFAAIWVLLIGCSTLTRAQTEDAFGDASADPVKLFERGQNAHARGDLIKALEFYDEAIRVRPEFAEAEFRLRAGDAREALELTRRATNDKEAPVSTWLLRAMAERATNDNSGALASLDHVLQVDPLNFSALMERAEIRIAAGDHEHAISDLKTAEPLLKGEKTSFSRLAADYELAGKPDEARRIAEAAGLNRPERDSAKGTLKVVGTPEEIEAANSDDPIAARKSLETLLGRNPNNAMLLARLGASYRTVDPSRSINYYKKAAELQPANASYATGYSAALVQARRCAEAAAVLRRVIAAAPNNYAAHANLATALYELKQFAAALTEYEWLLKAKPDLTVAYYFIATAHDYLGEYEQALQGYETFLARADMKTNQLEIEKVKLRLPSLRRQIQLGQGAKQKARHPTKQ